MHIKCPQCGFGRDVPDEKIPARTQLATCPKCKHKFKFRELAPPLEEKGESLDKNAGRTVSGTEPPPQGAHTDPDHKGSIWDQLESMGPYEEPSDSHGPEKDSFAPARGRHTGTVPWEELDKHGFFPGFFQTLKAAMLSPVHFFGSMSTGRGLAKPLVFFLIISEIQALSQIVWQMAGIVPGMEGDGGSIAGISLVGLGSLFLLILLPILLTVSLFIFAGLTHLCLSLFRSAGGGFEATFRAMCYGRAPLILSVVPVLGVLAGTVWTFFSTIVGLKELHRSSYLPATLGLFLPIFLFVALLLFMISSLGVAPPATY